MVNCAACYITVLEKITDYINEAAYAYMAVSGEGFTRSAWNGFLLNIKHLLKFSWANFIADVFIFIGKIALTCANVFSLIGILKLTTGDDNSKSIFGPCFIVAVCTYITATIVLGLFDTAVMALMTSLAIDMDLHGNRLVYGPPTFHDALSKITMK